jgi:hypothetical protein
MAWSVGAHRRRCLRRLGFRTQREIEVERAALNARLEALPELIAPKTARNACLGAHVAELALAIVVNPL